MLPGMSVNVFLWKMTSGSKQLMVFIARFMAVMQELK